MAAKLLPPIFEPSHLSQLLGLEIEWFARITKDTSSHYRNFAIPKKSGGARSLQAPSPTLLHCQRWIDAFIVAQLPVNDAAHGYVSGKSNISNADVHKDSRQILSMDISDFFGSIHKSRVIKLFFDAGYPPNVSYLLAELCCRLDYLPQGAASSPRLSNVIMNEFDRQLSAYAVQQGLLYTRYVDDITLSGDKIRKEHSEYVDALLETENLTSNASKFRVQRGSKRIVTGISLSNNRLQLPRSMRRRFKNQAFFLLKDKDEPIVDKNLDSDPIHVERQLGRLAYWRSVEPNNAKVGTMFEDLLRLSRR